MTNKITAKEYARINGLSERRVLFVISKKYSGDEKTESEWETVMVKDRIMDKPKPIKKMQKQPKKKEDSNKHSQK